MKSIIASVIKFQPEKKQARIIERFSPCGNSKGRNRWYIRKLKLEFLVMELKYILIYLQGIGLKTVEI